MHMIDWYKVTNYVIFQNACLVLEMLNVKTSDMNKLACFQMSLWEIQIDWPGTSAICQRPASSFFHSTRTVLMPFTWPLPSSMKPWNIGMGPVTCHPGNCVQLGRSTVTLSHGRRLPQDRSKYCLTPHQQFWSYSLWHHMIHMTTNHICPLLIWRCIKQQLKY